MLVADSQGDVGAARGVAAARVAGVGMILNADAQHIPLADQSVHCVITSPPYWGLRDYGVAGQLGLERTPEEYVAALVAVFREVQRVLRDDGTLWLNLGDSYVANGSNQVPQTKIHVGSGVAGPNRKGHSGLKPKDLVGIPWRVAFALQADGWYLRSDIIWAKPNPMPESVTDRPTKAHEYLFLLAKRERYYYDSDAIREPHTQAIKDGVVELETDWRKNLVIRGQVAAHKTGGPVSDQGRGNMVSRAPGYYGNVNGRNRRTVWEIATQPYPEAHFATFPEALVEPCVLAGTSERGVCRACGAPWEREREVTRSPDPHSRTGRAATGNGDRNDGDWPRMLTTSVTTGWHPTCACAAPTTQPLVLDPFAGSGTVGQVCHRLGRRFVGLELKPDYCRMAYARTAQLGLV